MEFPLSRHLLLKLESNIFSFARFGFYHQKVPTLVCYLHAGQRSVGEAAAQKIPVVAAISPCLCWTRTTENSQEIEMVLSTSNAVWISGTYLIKLRVDPSYPNRQMDGGGGGESMTIRHSSPETVIIFSVPAGLMRIFWTNP